MQMFYSLEPLKKYPTHKVSHKAACTDGKDLYLFTFLKFSVLVRNEEM